MQWELIVALVVAIPIVLFGPILVWVAVVSGLYQVARDRLRRRALSSRREAVGVGRVIEKPVTSRRVP